MHLLNDIERSRLADTLGDHVETTISHHLLRRSLCDAYRLGDEVYGAVVRDHNVPSEPTAFGNDVALIWQILQSLNDWFCVNIAVDMAAPLAALIEKDTGWKVDFLDDIYYALCTPAARFHDDAVRQLTAADPGILESAPEGVRATGFGGAQPLLENGFVAGAVVDGRIVAIAQTYARTQHYADIGIVTLPEYRGRGYATAAASIVAQRIQEAGQIPVWSTGDHNLASKPPAARTSSSNK